MQNQYPTAPSPATEKRSGGCLRGCLISLAVVGGIIILAVLFVLIFGRTLIARNLPALEARYPLLGPALDLTGMRAKLVVPVDTTKLQRGRQAGQNAKDRLPEDITVYPDPSAETYNIAANQVTAYQRVAEPLETVRAYFADAMAELGWELLLERQTDAGVQLSWAKAGRNCQVEFIERGDYTEVWLRSSKVP